MKRKLEAAILPLSLLLLAVLVCPQTVGAPTDHGLQTNSGFPSYLPLSSANTTETNNTATTQPLDEDITPENQLPLMIVIIVAAFAAYIAVIAVMASKKIR